MGQDASSPVAISIDFVGGGTPMAPTETAGVFPAAQWNSAAGTPSADCDRAGRRNRSAQPDCSLDRTASVPKMRAASATAARA